MRKILLISAHYPPSNLTATHRVRILAKYLPLFGWDPIVLTVDEKFYEEEPDVRLTGLIPDNQIIERVSAYKLTKPRLIGDLGLRAFFQLKKKANEIVAAQKIDFVYIFIPSFYLSLLGPLLNRVHGIKYGIDYIDPWVHFFPGSEKVFSRHWFSTQLSKFLEPIAVRGASLITSVSASYIQPIFIRNQNLKNSSQMLSFPYGWDPEEKEFIANYLPASPLFEKSDKLKLVYTGAFLPHSEKIFREWLDCIKNNIQLFSDVEIHFIGTGVSGATLRRNSITSIAKEFGVDGTIIFEHPNRISYFDVLYHTSIADGLFVLGSSETHYTPSKIFNAFIVEKPIFAILHPDSSATQIINETAWGDTCSCVNTSSTVFKKEAINQFQIWKSKTLSNSWEFDREGACDYSAEHLTSKLAATLTALF